MKFIQYKCFFSFSSPCFDSVTIVIATRQQYIQTEQFLFVDQFIHSRLFFFPSSIIIIVVVIVSIWNIKKKKKILLLRSRFFNHIWYHEIIFSLNFFLDLFFSFLYIFLVLSFQCSNKQQIIFII